MKKGFTLIEILVVLAIIGILAAVIISSLNETQAGFFSSTPKQPNEVQQASAIQKNLSNAVSIPQLTTSMERINIKRRAEIFNKEDKLSYIYLVNYGKVMAFFTVKGKVSSLRSYMVPTEKVVFGNGDLCNEKGTQYPECYVVESPDIDGAYGDNPEGIFFFTTEGAYVEWKGDYMMSDQPLKLQTTPELVRQIQ